MLTLPVFFFCFPWFARCVSAPPPSSPHPNGSANVLLLVFFWHIYIFFVSLHYDSHPCHGSCVQPLPAPCVCLCLCVLMCVPALLLNNPGYHVVLSADRNGSRPLVAPSRAPAQEKSLNVPQGKRRQSGPGESGDASSVRPQPWSPFCTCLTFIVTHYS